MAEKFSFGEEVPFPEEILELVFELRHSEDNSPNKKFDRIAQYEEVHHSKLSFDKNFINFSHQFFTS